MLHTATDRSLHSASVIAQQTDWLLRQASLELAHSESAWPWLEAAHIVGQTRFALHARVHGHMLACAWAEKNGAEFLAQLLRLALVPIGHLIKRLPLGNPGSGRVGALTPMPVPQHLLALIEQSRSALAAEAS